MFQNLPTKKTLDNVPIVEIVIFCTEIVIIKVILWCFFIGEVEIGKFKNLQTFQDKIVVWKMLFFKRDGNLIKIQQYDHTVV